MKREIRGYATLIIITSLIGGLTSQAVFYLFQDKFKAPSVFMFLMVILANWGLCIALLFALDWWTKKKRKK